MSLIRLFDTTLQRFQQARETSNERGSEFTLESVVLLYYYFQKIDIRRAESYIKCPDWLVNKGATIYPKNENDNKCFQYEITTELDYNKIKKKYLKEIEKIKQADKDFSSHQTDCGNFEQNNISIPLNVLFVSYNSEKIKLAYKSRYNSKRKNHVILQRGQKTGDFYCLNCFSSYTTENKLKEHEDICN